MYRNQSKYRSYCNEDQARQAGKKVIVGVMMVLVGICFMLEQQGYIASMQIGYIWPLIFCLFGLNRIVFARYDYDRVKGLMQIFVGFWVFACLEHLWGWTFAATWPMILIASGLCYILPVRRAEPKDQQGQENGPQS